MDLRKWNRCSGRTCERAGRRIGAVNHALGIRRTAVLVKGISDSFDDICRLMHARMWDVSLERLAEPAPVEPLRRAAGGAA